MLAANQLVKSVPEKHPLCKSERNLWETRNEEGWFSGRDVRGWSLGSPRNLSTWFCGWTPTASEDAVRISRGGAKPRVHISYWLPDQEPVSKSTSTFLRSESESAGELRIELWHLREPRIEPLCLLAFDLLATPPPEQGACRQSVFNFSHVKPEVPSLPPKQW